MRSLEMNKNLCMAFCVIALLACACSGDKVSGTSVEPNTMAQASSSSSADAFSSSLFDVSLSSANTDWSSSSVAPVLCKSSDMGGCVHASGDLWTGGSYDVVVDVVHYMDKEVNALIPHMEYGNWFAAFDDGDGGLSKIVWPVELGNSYSDDVWNPVIVECSGFCGTAVLEKGSLDYDPFVYVGFTMVTDYSDENDPKLVPVDVSNWGGICVAYMSDVALTLELGLGDSLDALLGWGLPSVSLPKTEVTMQKCFHWDDFELPSWVKLANTVDQNWLEESGWLKNAGAMAAARLVMVKFKIQAKPGSYKFNVVAVGTNRQ